MDLLARVRHTIRQHDLARADTRVVAAVSGGSDSVALAHFFASSTPRRTAFRRRRALQPSASSRGGDRRALRGRARRGGWRRDVRRA